MSKKLIVPAAKPYAEALFTASDNEIISDMIRIREILNEVKQLEEYFASPIVDAKTKKLFVKKAFDQKISNITLNFLLLLIDRKRINILSAITDNYIQIKNRRLREQDFEITTVVPLTDDQNTELRELLKKLSAARVLKITVKQDPTIFGGLLIQTGSRVIDLSVHGELRKISNYLGCDFEC